MDGNPNQVNDHELDGNLAEWGGRHKMKAAKQRGVHNISFWIDKLQANAIGDARCFGLFNKGNPWAGPTNSEGEIQQITDRGV